MPCETRQLFQTINTAFHANDRKELHFASNSAAVNIQIQTNIHIEERVHRAVNT